MNFWEMIISLKPRKCLSARIKYGSDDFSAYKIINQFIMGSMKYNKKYFAFKTFKNKNIFSKVSFIGFSPEGEYLYEEITSGVGTRINVSRFGETAKIITFKKTFSLNNIMQISEYTFK